MDIVKKPVLIEMWDERFFYFVLKFEFNFVDTLDKASLPWLRCKSMSRTPRKV